MNCISEKFNVIFVHNPKTGGKSVSDLLLTSPNFETIHIETLSDKYDRRCGVFCKIQQKVDTDGYSLFSFVRNPYDRFVSNWKFFRSHLTLDEVIAEMNHGFYKNRNDRFFQKIAWHFKPQFFHLPENFEIYRFEEFSSNLEFLSSRYGIDYVEKAPTHKSKRNNLQDYLKYDKLIEVVNKFYKDDFIRFSYEML